jgi:hypothetical protein
MIMKTLFPFVLAALLPLAAFASKPTETQVNTLMGALGKVVVDGTPIAYSGGETPTTTECADFVAHVKAQLKAVISNSESAFALLDHLSKSGKKTLIRCSKVRNGTNNLGHTWWTTGASANVKNKAGTAVAECNSVVSLQQWQGCVAKLTEGSGAFTAPEAVHEFGKHIQDVVIGVDHDTTAKAKPPTTTANKFVSLNVTRGALSKAACATNPQHTVDEDFGVILFHELIHAARMLDGKFIGGHAASEATDEDRKAFVDFLVAHAHASVATNDSHRDKITTAQFRELATGGGYDHEELQTVLAGGATAGTHQVSENQIRVELGGTVLRCHYSR